jgi:hypothetical protein
LLKREGGRAYQRVSGSNQYAPITISFLEKGLQGISVDFGAPQYHGIDLARRRRVDIEPVVERNLRVGDWTLDQRPLHLQLTL